MAKGKKTGQAVCFWMLILQLLSSVLFGLVFVKLGMFPTVYQIILVVVLAILLAVPLALQKTTFRRIMAIFFSMIVSAVLLMGSLYLWKTNEMLDDITVEDMAEDTRLEDVAIIVLDKDPAQSINETAGYTYGIQAVIDRANTDTTIQSVEEHIASTLKVQEYDSLIAQIEALYNQEVGAIIMNQKFQSLVLESFETFALDTRVLSSYKYERFDGEVIEGKEEKLDETIPESNAFCVFLSGIDTFGSVSAVSRSDVNIIAAVNPDTKQVLLLTTPRDYYVELPFYEGCMDKLTHAGIYGIDISMQTLENLYGVEIENYARVNFTGFQNMVDALGGVEVYCQIPFTTGTQSFHEGYNYVNGEAALSFVRERYAFSAGDIQRGRNQMEMIKAIAKKIISPSILANYTSFMGSLSSFVTTDMDKDMIADLVKMQLTDGASWNIVSYNVSGTGTNSTTYSMGNQSVYVMIPDESTIATAKELLRQVYAGETLAPVQ